MTAGTASSEVLVTELSQGIFTLNGGGTGVPLAAVSAVLKDQRVVSLPPYQCSLVGCNASQIVSPDDFTDLYIVLYGPGIRRGHNTSATLGSLKAGVDYAGAQPSFPGLDQVNVHLKGPFNLSGPQVLNLQIDGINANPVIVQFQ